jgi:hypothetical protein
VLAGGLNGILFMKGCTVFNVEQIDGLSEQYYARPECRRRQWSVSAMTIQAYWRPMYIGALERRMGFGKYTPWSGTYRL